MRRAAFSLTGGSTQPGWTNPGQCVHTYRHEMAEGWRIRAVQSRTPPTPHARMKFLNLGSKEAHAKPHHCIPDRWFNNCAKVPQIADNTILWVLTLNTEVFNWKDWEIKKCDQQKWDTNLVLVLQKYQGKHSRLILTTRRFKKREKRKNRTKPGTLPFRHMLLVHCAAQMHS